MINFVNKGTDEAILKSLPTENCDEDLVKAMNKQGMVQKEVQVRGKNGTFTRKQWVRASEAVASDGGSKSTNKADNGGKKVRKVKVLDDVINGAKAINRTIAKDLNVYNSIGTVPNSIAHNTPKLGETTMIAHAAKLKHKCKNSKELEQFVREQVSKEFGADIVSNTYVRHDGSIEFTLSMNGGDNGNNGGKSIASSSDGGDGNGGGKKPPKPPKFEDDEFEEYTAADQKAAYYKAYEIAAEFGNGKLEQLGNYGYAFKSDYKTAKKVVKKYGLEEYFDEYSDDPNENAGFDYGSQIELDSREGNIFCTQGGFQEDDNIWIGVSFNDL